MGIPELSNARKFYRVALQRYDDALLLFELKRMTAAIYLAGYCVECMLKALILTAVIDKEEERILSLFRGGRAHDHEWLLRLYRQHAGASLPKYIVPHFARVNSWSTDMRYMLGATEGAQAKAFLDSVPEIIKWADGRL